MLKQIIKLIVKIKQKNEIAELIKKIYEKL